MPRKPDPAAELAQKLIAVLKAQRVLGEGSYPPTVGRLGQLTDPGASEALIFKAIGKKPFAQQMLAAQAKALESPIALSDDMDRLAASPRLLEFLLSQTCNPSNPLATEAELKKLVTPRLRPLFSKAIKDSMEKGLLPATVAIVQEKKKIFLHWLRYPLPKGPEEVLAESLAHVLREKRRESGGVGFLTLSQLLVQAKVDGAGPIGLKTLRNAPFTAQMLFGLKFKTKGNAPLTQAELQTPVCLPEDADAMADSPQLLEASLGMLRTETTQAFSLKDIQKNIVERYGARFMEGTNRRIENRQLPPTVGCVRIKAKPMLFLMQDANPQVSPGASAPGQVKNGANDFGERFDRAFRQLEQQARVPNFVNLKDLRRLLPIPAESFNAELRKLRVAGRYTLSAAEGRHGITPEEQAAGIVEDGALLLYVSRKSS